ncbi:MAG: AtpZ/AtpI family protein [Alistipes sp.]|nr:AtpZ/AtpI family protein [Alistipes sp.]
MMKNKNPFIDESAFEGDDTPKKSEDEILMEEAKQHTEVVEVKTYMSLGMVIGLGVGAVVGSFFGMFQFGMGIGMLIGLIAGLCIHKKPEEK